MVIITYIEDKLESLLKNTLCVRYEREKIIEVEGGYYKVDFFLPDFNIVIEADGEIWHKRQNREIERDKKLQTVGLKVLHFRGRTIIKHHKDMVRELRKEIQLRTPVAL